MRSQLEEIYLFARAKSASSLLPRSTARIERGFGGLLAAPHRFELLVHHVADLHEIADAQPFGALGRRLEIELLHRHVASGEFFIESLRASMLIGRLGNRHVARLHVPLRLHIGAGQVA